jgi:hypothetical protein
MPAPLKLFNFTSEPRKGIEAYFKV